MEQLGFVRAQHQRAAGTRDRRLDGEKSEALRMAYVVIDEGWYVTNPPADPKSYKFKISRDGFFRPDEDRFPSACNGAGLEVELQLVRLTPKELLTRRKLKTWRRDGIKSLPLRHSMSYRVSQDALSAFGAPPNSW
jgi:hypothetical protein